MKKWTSVAALAVLFGITTLLVQSSDGSLADVLSAEHLVDGIPETHRRYLRSVEGAPCTTTGGLPSIYPGTNWAPVTIPPVSAGTISDTCLLNGLPNTRCNNVTGHCECDPAVSVKLSIIPNAAICLPLAYVNQTNGLCLPSFPDMCTVQVAGSYCASVQNTNGARQLKCLCKSGLGSYPNCQPRLGGPCQNTTVCALQMANSYCANITAGWGTCGCPIIGTPIIKVWSANAAPTSQPQAQTTIPNLQQTQCVPQYCPYLDSAGANFIGIQPCQGDVTPVLPTATGQPYTCTNTSTGYNCVCNQGTKGHSHNATTPGRCCLPTDFACADYSMCYTVQQMCDGVVNCDDCSDEKWPFCSGAWPSNPACGLPTRALAPGDEFFDQMNFAKMDTATVVLPAESIMPSFDSVFAQFKVPTGKTFQDAPVVANEQQSPSQPSLPDALAPAA